MFLFALALIWIFFASVQDLKEREVANWLNFSLIIFALGFRFFYSLFSIEGFWFFYQGLIGLGIFFIIGNLFYYTRLFAGGDAKLMIALGTILPISRNFLDNFNIFILFLAIFLFVGAVYGFLWSLVLTFKNFKNFKKEFGKKLLKLRKIVYLVFILGLILMALGLFIEIFIFFLGILVFVSPYFYIYAKAVDEACMVKKINSKELREGDWLYKEVKLAGKKSIKATWEGVSNKEIVLIRKKHKSVLIRQGIPFVPVFLISFLILIILGYSFWQPYFLF